MAIIPGVYVEAPPVRPLRFGLFSVAPPALKSDGPWTAGGEWESDACDVEVNVASELCETEEPKTPTDADGGVTAMTPFSVYVLRECRSVADFARASDRANKMLVNAEQYGVETQLWAMFADAATNAVDITPAAVPTVKAGVALLEKWMGDHYRGEPTIHMGRGVASLAYTGGVIERHGSHMETGLGAHVAAGAGYDDLEGPEGVDAAAGSFWVFATGPVVIMQGQSNVRGPFLTQAPNHDNTQVVLAERTYSVGFDCVPVGIRVLLP